MDKDQFMNMSEDERNEYMNRRENRPGLRFTAIFPAANGNNFPSQEVINALLMSFKELIAAVGFTQSTIALGTIGAILEDCKTKDPEFMDEAGFKKAVQIRKGGELRAKESKISIEEMFKGIDLTKTKEKGI